MYSDQLSYAEQKTGVDTGGGFFSLGQKKKLKDVSAKLENSVLKSKVHVLGEVLKKHIDSLRNAEKTQVRGSNIVIITLVLWITFIYDKMKIF